MRITNQMVSDRALAGMTSLYDLVQHAQDQITSGRRISQPSDDPAGTRRAIRLQETLDQTTQYSRNIDTADGRLTAADSALSGAADVMQRARELAVQGANGSLSASDRNAMASEVEQLARSMVGQAATKFGSDYVFSGFQTGTPPYAEAPAGTATVSAYAGDAGQTVVRIGPGVTIPTNVAGDATFKPALDALAQLHADLTGGDAVQASTIASIDTGQAALTDAWTEIGARQNRLDQTKTSLGDLQLTSTKLLSDLKDVDLAEAITELTSRQTAYEAAAKANGRVLSTSLLDYLK